jgi:hypothetical protein
MPRNATPPDHGAEGTGSWIQGQNDPGFGSASKNLSILNQKISFKLSEILILDPDFFPSRIRIQGSKKYQILYPGSGCESN